MIGCWSRKASPCPVTPGGSGTRREVPAAAGDRRFAPSNESRWRCHEDRYRVGPAPNCRQSPSVLREYQRIWTMKFQRSTARLQTATRQRSCPQYGDDGIITSWHRQAFVYGSGESVIELAVDVPVRYCGACEFQYLDEEAERLRHEAVCGHLGVLSPAQIRCIRERHRNRLSGAGGTDRGRSCQEGRSHSIDHSPSGVPQGKEGLP